MRQLYIRQLSLNQLLNTMNIDTSTKEAARRNLILTSLAFILFTLGEAKLGKTDGSSTIKVLSGDITFSNPDILQYFAWTMFFWFLVRFLQFSDFKEDWRVYCETIYKTKAMDKLFEKSKGKTGTYSQNIHQPFWGEWRWPIKNGGVLLVKPNEIFVKLKLFLYVAITTEKFGQFYFPYIIAIAALIITIVNV